MSDLPDVLELGSGVRLRISHHPDSSEPTGGIIEHDCDQIDPEVSATPGKCSGSIFFDVPWTAARFTEKARWKVESWEPLTLSPSIRTFSGDRENLHEHHGFIREGKWVEA